MSKDASDRHEGTGEPSIDCLMVTLPVAARLPFAKRSIRDFCRQTYRNKQLIVMINGGTRNISQELRGYIHALGRPDIVVLEPKGQFNLGQLRNLSIEAATADFVCQWDDDDLNHPERLELQARHLKDAGHEAVYLRDVMQFFPKSGALYWTNWINTAAAAHPGTLMARRSAALRYPTEGQVASLGEDLILAQGLIETGGVGYLSGMAHLFVYVSHGANSWHDAHHTMLSNTLAISRALLRRREAEIRLGLEPYGFPKGCVTMTGSNGAAFAL
jgi:glycosyltransferase involved in cell wall biosynthesis